MAQPHPFPLEVGPGDIVAGKYRVDRVLGAGGMGVVVAARHLQLDSPVAIKMLRPALVDDGEVLLRFEREARAAARVTNEHVARVFDVGTLPSGSPYMVMELLEGADLGAMLRQSGTMPIPQAVDFVLQACAALHEAHSLGIIHRDLKPANLFCVRRPDGQPFIKVLDFGISKLSDATRSGVSATQTSALLGTPLYMSPEQMRSSKDVNLQTDIWSLGVVLFELLTGTPPFIGDTLPEICVRIATEPPPPLRTVRADVPVRLEAVVSRCLERDRAMRFASAGELAAALVEFAPAWRGPVPPLADPGYSARREPTPPPSASAPRSAKTPFGGSGRSAVPSDRRRLTAIGAGAVFLMAVVIGMVVWLGGHRKPVLSNGTVVASPVAPPPASASTTAVPPPAPAATGLAPLPSDPGTAAPETNRSTPSRAAPAQAQAARRSSATAAPPPRPSAAPGRPPAPTKADDAYERM
jgi:serine/threonine-protein kinase